MHEHELVRELFLSRDPGSKPYREMYRDIYCLSEFENVISCEPYGETVLDIPRTSSNRSIHSVNLFESIHTFLKLVRGTCRSVVFGQSLTSAR